MASSLEKLSLEAGTMFESFFGSQCLRQPGTPQELMVNMLVVHTREPLNVQT